ncbi:hypothetical protein D3C83_77210 [compost metagenome]
MPFSRSKVASSDLSGEEASPVPEPQPTRIRLNSGSLFGPPPEARLKKTLAGMVTTLVGMPPRVSIWAITSQIFASFT